MKTHLKRSGTTLTAFALVTTGLIAITNELTAPRIKSQEQQQLQKILGSIVPPALHDNDIEHDCTLVTDANLLGDDSPKTVYRARLQGEPVALVLQTMTPDGYSGDIDLLVGVNLAGKVTGVRVLKHQETPGLGDKIDIRISDWILSFDGKGIDNGEQKNWAVKKDGGQFDQFTGATITPRAMVKAVKNALLLASEQQQMLFAAPNQCQPHNSDSGDHHE
ncbi:electron transport complex subunit RsxG [Bowmanella yangjiangensis]|uniref:Ion-translocating oxidoreductase complex subunit G n=1 Tax=Bowmanella yangjiangensis TaxID=2811230 RepID=A0ABS3CUY6_9ALTE|nr:electron transport complex subunit RsxG [Bowmanella yangjiangensis]MBN7820941.1 electron transport complex subunit RsxG [Bowmanella yangjiangensis]